MKRIAPPRERVHGTWTVWVSNNDGQTWRQVGRPRMRHEAITLGRAMRVNRDQRVAVMPIGRMPRA